MSRARSPSYPSIPLKEAIEQVSKIFAEDRRNPIDRAVAAKHMGYAGISGTSDMTLAALMHFGLLERVAKGEVKVTQLALELLHPDPADPKKYREALLQAAYAPALFRNLRERFPDGTFSRDALKSHLIREGFVDRAVGLAAKSYSETSTYLEREKAFESGGPTESIAVKLNPPDSDKTAVRGGARVGDLIQWESNGVLQFQPPRRVRLVTDDGQWVGVEGSETGIPMNEVVVEERASTPPPAAPRFPISPVAQVEPSSKGETEWIRNMVGRDTNVRLLVTGTMGPKEITRLIRLLEAQKAVLLDDDDLEDN